MRPFAIIGLIARLIFQSTHPLRGATRPTTIAKPRTQHFNPRTPCGVRRVGITSFFTGILFQSTHPLRGATCRSSIRNSPPYRISIHAPLAGCDGSFGAPACPPTYFNPRTPCGVRRIPLKISGIPFLFQSTHPLRGATTAHSPPQA